MIKAIAIKDFYYSKTKKAYRKDREYLFTKEQFEELYSAGFIISDVKVEKEMKEIKIEAVPNKNKKYIKFKK